jgi:hypothetical protein
MTGTVLRFCLTAAYELSGGAAWKYAGAAEGLLLAARAVYAALPFELEDNRPHTVLPTFRRGVGGQALSGSISGELAGARHEAGVRKQLSLAGARPGKAGDMVGQHPGGRRGGCGCRRH